MEYIQFKRREIKSYQGTLISEKRQKLTTKRKSEFFAAIL